ncbi:MAG TPA: CAP domain-containing protein [candidate division Zixibacteria bacterium]|nr:CAP domain-containing protein [candidate division Zixibacteria bacterium]
MTLAPASRPRRVLLRAVGLAGTALMAAALLAWTPQPATGWNQGAAEATVWQLLNGARVNNGRRALQQHSTLISLARWRSKDQVDRNYFSHTILGTGYAVYHWYDLNGLRYSWGGENIGWNNGFSDGDSPVEIHEGFMDSPGHRANILEPSFTHGGVGAYAKDNVMFLGKLRSPRFYTQLFMQAASAAPPPPPPPPSGGGSAPPRPRSGGSSVSRAAAPTAAPSPATVRTEAATAPRPSQPMDGASLLAAADLTPSTAAVRALAWADEAARDLDRPDVEVAGGMRVRASVPAERGMFETVIGSLLGFLF